MEKNLQYIVVDDDTTNNMICELNIRRFNKEADVELFVSPEEALDYIRLTSESNVEDYQAILFLDINMPTMTGWDFLDIFSGFSEKVRKRFTIYILTSAIQSFEQEQKKYPFVVGFLSKPLTKTVLEKIFNEQPAGELIKDKKV